MAIKSEISWKRLGTDGKRREIYARRFGGEWRFHHRERRHDVWQAMPDPPLEDWLHLLDALERRVTRRLSTPAELARVLQAIRERHPEYTGNAG